MIIVRLIGGLGNQMFQYAAARRLAEHNSTILKLDVTGFEKYKLHRYSLHCFYIWEHFATQYEIDSILKQNSNVLLKQLIGIGEIFGIKNGNTIFRKNGGSYKEPHFHFDQKLLSAPNNIYLDGYWQSEKYFYDIKEILQTEFKIKYSQSVLSKEIAAKILNTESISLHIRREDYVNNSSTLKKHGTCSPEYYKLAIDYCTQRLTSPHFFIFSDEPQWVKENFKFDFPITIIDHNDATRNYDDLRLMSLCKHNILANSSFSWWAAWLNTNQSKIVIAPGKWFASGDEDDKDLIPETWIRI